MIFNTIILTNIGPYEGQNIIRFNNNQESRTTLIGGKNGSGKTTFLNSVRLGLYGSLAFGYKTASSDYIRKIKSLLNSNACKRQSEAVKDYEEEFSIKIEFSFIKDFKRVQATIIREWMEGVNFTKLTENVTVLEGTTILNEVEKDQFFSHLRTSFPPSLLELCFFDGEEIAHLTDEDNLSHYLKVLSSKIFNLDLFQDLEQDLNQYVNQSSKSKGQIKLEEELSNVQKELMTKTNLVDKLHKDIQTTKERQEDKKLKYETIKKDFSLHGGIAAEERNKLQDEILEIETTRKHIQEKVKEFIAFQLPFFIAFPKLRELVDHLHTEEDYHVSNVLNEKINSLPVSELVKVLGIDSSKEKEELLRSSLSKHLVQTENVRIIHNASKTESQQIYSLFSDINDKKLKEVISLIKKNQNLLAKVQKYRKKLKDNEESSEFAEMIQSMEEYNQELALLEKKSSSLSEQFLVIKKEWAEANKKHQRIKQDLYNIHKTKSSFEDSKRIIEVSRKFQEQQLRNKIRDIEYFSTKMIKELIRKKEFIRAIKIDHKQFTLTLLDYNNDKINKDILSAGEKELLALSIIWGTIVSSKKELPLILDTLLGRLDLEHKYSIVTKLLPKFGVQNIVLSTDSEIDQNLYNNLSGAISNEYTLNYQTEFRRTNIEKHFFYLNNEKVKETS